MSKTAERAARAKAAFLIAAFAARWPKAFAIYERRRRPLALHIHRAIIAASGPGIAKGAISTRDLHAALRFYCGNDAYLRGCRKGAARIDLAGNPVGIVTASEAAYAARARKSITIRRQQKKNVPRAAVGTSNLGAQRHSKNGKYARTASGASPV